MFYFDCYFSSSDKDCSNFCRSVVFPAPILPSMVIIGTCIFAIVLQNNLEAISTCGILINSIITLQLLRVSIWDNTESKRWVEDYLNVLSNVTLLV